MSAQVNSSNATGARPLIVQFKAENPSAEILEDIRQAGITLDKHLGLGVYVCQFTGNDVKAIEDKEYVEGVLVPPAKKA
ncbi:hypothetical protein Micbo1qcDRAFT_165813 [Microdochium bolleyi]|uniref:Inhibitor I9 domain-containing protein n=1 Tax=Microdochium bolleyi TaxID=196109 RepID=A0A136IVT7_9PEZI|nr:hypothetical protein Micbo1qcDRAFT_165813 [Microdochium bolleyi]